METPRLRLEGHTAPLTCVCVAPDELAITGARDGTVSVFDCARPARVGELYGHTDWVRAVCFVGDLVASASFDGTIRIWDTQQQRAVLQLTAPGVWCLEALHSSGRLLAGDAAGLISAWDPQAHRESPVFTVCAHRGDGVSSIAAPEPGIVFSAGFDGAVHQWRIEDGVRTCSNTALEPPVLQLCVSEGYVAVLQGPCAQVCLLLRGSLECAWRSSVAARARGLALVGDTVVSSWSDQVLRAHNCMEGWVHWERPGSYASLHSCCPQEQPSEVMMSHWLLGSSFGKPCFAHAWKLVEKRPNAPTI